MNRKICVVTSTRADYGLLRWVMQGIQDSAGLTLQIIATGMHLSPEFGLTYQAIEEDGFSIDRKVEMLTSSDSPVGISKSMGLGLIGFADALNELSPDLILVLGDRFEIFSAVSAALTACIPVAHLHGGETTEGAFDDAFRHSITKMSHLHFVATEDYRRRVIQLGERPDHVFLVGGMGVDSIARLELLSKEALETSLNCYLGGKSLLITFHPVTLDGGAVANQMGELLIALESLNDVQLIFTLPNADTNSRTLIKMVKEFVAKNSNANFYTSLGQQRYLSLIAHVDGVIGNSSSGLLEAPSFKKGTVNIGNRQKGRAQANSVINCDPKNDSITAGINLLFSEKFQKTLRDVVNPYGDGGASERVVNIIKQYPLTNLNYKTFYDLDFPIDGG